MSKKSVTIFLSIICIVGLVVSIFLYISKDRQAPTISYTGDITYNEGDDVGVLLEGVTALDDKDGDVSDSLMIESIYKSGDKAKVVYCAYDTSNNVSKLQRIVSYNSEVRQEEPVVEVDYEEELKNSKITILNGTTTSNVAAYWKEDLESKGYKTIEVATSLDKTNTTLIYTDNENYKSILSALFPSATFESGKPSNSQMDLNDSVVVIVIGEDNNTIKNSNSNTNNEPTDNNTESE